MRLRRLTLTGELLQDPAVQEAAEEYQDKHWGHEAQDAWEVDTSHHPKDWVYTQMGHLMGLGFIPYMGHFELDPEALDNWEAWQRADFNPRRVPGEAEGIQVIEFPRKDDCMLVWDPGIQGVYFLYPKAVAQRIARRFAQYAARRGTQLPRLAKWWGGKRTRRGPHRPVPIVLVLGELAWTMYKTEKGNYEVWEGSRRLSERGQDGMSEYVHPAGEEGGKRSLLCLAKDGSLWLAGGDYTLETGGMGD